LKLLHITKIRVFYLNFPKNNPEKDRAFYKYRKKKRKKQEKGAQEKQPHSGFVPVNRLFSGFSLGNPKATSKPRDKFKAVVQKTEVLAHL
jgi:hypothetical protein